MKPTLRAALAALALLLPLPAAALDTAGARALLLDLQRLDIETVMMLYDETDREGPVRARKVLEAVEAPVAGMLADLRRNDAATADAAGEAWTLLEATLAGDRSGTEGMLNSGYDAKAFAELRTALADLTAAIERQYKVREDVGAEQAALLTASNVVMVYIRTAGAPFGSYSDNNDQNVESLEDMVARLDGQLAALARKHAGNPEKLALVKRANTKWQFVRSTILKYTQQATPSIVYRHGLDIIAQLRALQP